MVNNKEPIGNNLVQLTNARASHVAQSGAL